MPIEIFAGYLP